MTSSKKSDQKTGLPEKGGNSGSGIFVLILCCFFISGFTGLIYEILWTRMIVKIIGSAPFAVSIVLTIFMGGLGLGSYLASRSIDRIKNPLRLIRLYGILELVVGAYGIVLPLLLVLFKPVYALIYNHLFGYFLGYNLITFIGCLFLLIIPVTCMGATLPVLSRFFIRSISSVGTHVGRLYGLNTIGAATGSIICGFWLIGKVGIWGTLFLAIILNVIIGLLSILISLRYESKGRTPSGLTEAATRAREEETIKREYPTAGGNYDISALIIFGVSGFCAMAYEVIWTKLLGLIVGPTTYSFTIVLVTFIMGLAIGSIFFGWLGDRIRNIMLLLLFTQVSAALFALLVSQLMGSSQIFFAKLILEFKDNFVKLEFIKAVILFFFMFFPTFCLGATFPLVGKIYTRTLSRTGRSIGFAYSINSAGAILGSFCAGFLLIPFLGKEQGLRLVILVQLLAPLFVWCFLLWKDRKKHFGWIAVTVPILIGLILLTSFPHWDRKMLSVGRYHRFDKPEIRGASLFKTFFAGKNLFPEFENSEIVYFGDGIAGFVTVMQSDIDILGNKGYVLYCSGKPEASTKMDMDTQTLSAHVPMLFHKDPKKMLVVGLASGITAGEFLHYPLEKLDIIDINRQVVGASDFFRPWNNNVLSHPKVELIIQDARAHMALSNRKYDVISSEPSNPWMAGLAALFTEDFFELVRARLNDSGIFVQFIHSYQMDWPTFSLVGRTFARVFPNSLLMRTNPLIFGPDFLLVGFKNAFHPEEEILKQRIAFAYKSKNVTLKDHRVLYPLIVNQDLKTLFGEGPINTDARPTLEFSAPKLLHADDPVIIERLKENISQGDDISTVLMQAATDVDFQIDFAEFATSIIKPELQFQSMVDLSRASTAQKERFYSVIKELCEKNIITDYSFIHDPLLKKECITSQIEKVHNRLQVTGENAILYILLGNLYTEIGMIDKAFMELNKALAIKSDDADVHFDLAIFLSKQGRTAEAVEHYLEVLRINPYYLNALNNLAWILATHGDKSIRNGERAVQLAEQACRLKDKADPFLLDTLAAAYAEAGRFKEAQQIARKSMEISSQNGLSYLTEKIKNRLDLYISNRAYHEESPFKES